MIKKLLKGLYFVLMTITLTVVTKVFLIESFKATTGSMEPVILPGDHVFVNKLLIGPRIYRDFGFLKGEKTPLIRWRGLRKIQRNDILAFNSPYTFQGTLKMNPDRFYGKRCIAVPGDTLAIVNGIYQIKGYHAPVGNYPGQLQLSQTPDEVFDEHVFNCFPNDTIFCWTIKDFGPLYIPGKGDRIELNPQNIVLYSSLIQYETGQRITVREEQIFLDRDTISSFIFTQNYYFMAGDFVSSSNDSRYWGLLPEDFVVGKVAIVLKSKEPETGKIRWKRFLKLIN